MAIIVYIALGLAILTVIVYKDEIYSVFKRFAISKFPWIRVLQPQINKPPSELTKLLDRDKALSALSEENIELKKELEKYKRIVTELEKKLKYPTEIKLYEALAKENSNKINAFIKNSFVITRADTKVMSKDGGILGKLLGLFIGPDGMAMVALQDKDTNKKIYLGPEEMSVMFPSNFIRSMKNGVLPVNYDDKYELIPDAYIGRIA